MKWLNTADCKSALFEFGGSNPSSSTISFTVEPLAQLVEHLTFNQGVVGSNPTWLTMFKLSTCGHCQAFLCFEFSLVIGIEIYYFLQVKKWYGSQTGDIFPLCCIGSSALFLMATHCYPPAVKAEFNINVWYNVLQEDKTCHILAVS